MKTKLILGSIIALTNLAYAQVWTTGIGAVTTTGKVGIGNNLPSFKLDVKLAGSLNPTFDGLSIDNTGSALEPGILLKNTNVGARSWSMKSISGNWGGGAWRLSDETNQVPVLEVLGDGRTFIRTVSIGPNSGRLNVATDSEPYAVSADNIGQFSATGVRAEAAGNGAAGSFSRGMLSVVYNAEENQGGDFNAYGGSRTKGIICKASGGTSNNTGGHFLSIGNSGGSGSNYGAYAESNTSGYGVGIYAKSIGASPNGFYHYGGVFESNGAGSPKNIGSASYAGGGSGFNVGVVGAADGTGSSWIPVFPLTHNIGVYGTANLSGPYTSPSNNWAGWFDNDVMINGTGYNSAFSIFTSDRRFKKDIRTIENASSVIAHLNPSTYYMTTENEYGMHFSSQKQFGFTSQEVEAILPDLVATVHKPANVDSTGKEVTKAIDFKGLNYMGFIALLTKGMQEQQSLIQSQQQQIDELKSLVYSLSGNKPANNVGANSIPVTLNDKNVLVLDQNVPNPFAESTVISYNIPNDFTKAQIIFMTNEGKVIKVLDITTKGAGSLNVFANDLSHGIYSYSLIVDGKTIDTKKMVKE